MAAVTRRRRPMVGRYAPLGLQKCGLAGVRPTVSWWLPKWQCPSDLSGIFAVPSNLALHFLISQEYLRRAEN